MNAIKDIFSKNLRQSGIVFAFVAIVVLFTILTGGTLLAPNNVSNLVLQYSYILILAIGMLFVIVIGHIDLSVGSVMALVGAVAATMVVKNAMPWWLAVIAGIAVGLVIGAWQGFWVAYVGIPGFIVTLSGMLLFRGMTFLVLNSVSLSPMSAEYQMIASGFINGLLGGAGFDVFTLVVAAIAVAGYAYSQFRTRQARIRYEQQVESMGLFIFKLVAIAAVVYRGAGRLTAANPSPQHDTGAAPASRPFALRPALILAAVLTLALLVGRWGADVLGAGGTVLAAFAAVIVSAGWYIVIFQLTPASMRPYMGGSQTNSFLELVFSYNGLGRITGTEVGSVGQRGPNSGTGSLPPK